MEKNVSTNECPTIKDTISFLKEMLDKVYTLANHGVICDEDTYDAFELYSNVLEGVLLSGVLLLSVEEQFEGNPTSYYVYILNSDQDALDIAKQLGNTTECRTISVDEFKTIAGFDWDNPNCYTTLDDKPCYRMKWQI